MGQEMQKLNIFTHDMRNCLVPLSIAEALLDEAVKLLVGTMDTHKPRAGWDKVKRSFEKIVSVRNNLITLIDQSLAYAKRSKSNYVKEKMALEPVISETIIEISYHKYLKDKDIQFYIHDGEVVSQTSLQDKNIEPDTSGPFACHFNYLDIKRVLQNLLINAGCASQKGGKIEVHLAASSEYIKVSVKDFGSGISDLIKPLLLKENITTKPDGNGFGLLSCRDIILEYHGGKIWFESEEGKGTQFHLTLPTRVPDKASSDEK